MSGDADHPAKLLFVCSRNRRRSLTAEKILDGRPGYVQRSSGFYAVNLLQGWPPVRIVNPLELIYGNQDQDI